MAAAPGDGEDGFSPATTPGCAKEDLSEEPTTSIESGSIRPPETNRDDATVVNVDFDVEAIYIFGIPAASPFFLDLTKSAADAHESEAFK